MSRVDFKKDRRKERQEQAAVRQEEYDALSVEQRVARANSQPGNSKRQLARLGVQLAS